MKLIGIIIKFILAALASALILHNVSILYRIVVFALLYGLITYYIYYFKNSEGEGFSIWIGDGSLLMNLLEIGIKIFAPILSILVMYWILSAIFGETAGTNIAGVIILVASFGCLITDIVGVIKVFNPNFLGDWSKKDSGFIEDTEEQDE